MKYYLTYIPNEGDLTLVSQHSTLNSAIEAYHSLCKTCWGSSDIETAKVAILDESFNKVNGYYESIIKE